MPYAPGVQFDPSLIFKGISNAGDALGGGLADMMKKRKEAEAQAAGSMIQFQTLKNAGLLSPEEETLFHNGNATKKAAIVTSATPRLLQKFKTEDEQRQTLQAQMQRDLQWKIAQLHYAANSGNPPQSPVVDTRTGLTWNGRQWVKPPSSSDAWAKNVAIARGKLDEQGNFTNQYTGAEQGDQVQLRTPQGKTVVVPWSVYQERMQQQPADTQQQPAQAPETPPAQPQAPTLNQTPVQVRTVEEANALPSGTIFITPDGKLKRKP